MTYGEVLQTISTVAGVVGVSTGLYISVIAKRVHRSVDSQTQDLKQSIKEQTGELTKNGR